MDQANKKNEKELTGEALEKTSGGVGLKVCREPRHSRIKKGLKFPYGSPDVPEDEPKDGGATGSW